MLLSRRVRIPCIGAFSPRKETKPDAEWHLPTDYKQPETNEHQQPVRNCQNRPARRAVANRTNRKRQITDIRQLLHGHTRISSRLNSWRRFVTSRELTNTTPSATRVMMWQELLDSLDVSVKMNINAKEHLPAGAENTCTASALNRLSTQGGWPRTNAIK